MENNNKVIVAGHLEFGAERNYEQVVRLFEHRRENYYRNDIFLKVEDIFQPENQVLDIPRIIVNCTDKQWRNTTNLLKQITEFAISGDLNLWRIRETQSTEHLLLEPRGDKSATQAFLRGRQLVDENGREDEAREALSEAIDKFGRHAMAYERRGYVNYRLGNLKDAHYDYTRSLAINASRPEAYYGRALVHRQRGEWAEAAADLTEAIRYAIPHQNVYWQARCLKGDALVQLAKLADAAKEYKFFLTRRRPDDDPLLHWERRIFFAYGKILTSLGQYKEAVEAFNRALPSPEHEKAPADAEILLHRGLAAQQLGQKTFVEDWKRAAKQGSERAAELLEGLA